jgi:hypothetical protein
VQFSQHNLPANGKRQLASTVHVPGPLTDPPTAAFVSGLPAELPAMDMQSVSPSGRRALVARSHDNGVLLEVWDGNRLVKELQVGGFCWVVVACGCLWLLVVALGFSWGLSRLL